MADISKINLSGAVYNIKDATARANLNEIQNISDAEIDEITDFVLESLPSSYIYGYETAAAMQADLDLQEGMIAHINGFNTSGDGNSAYYTISNSGTVNGSTILALQNGLKAIQISENSSITTAKIVDRAVTTIKIADDAITADKIASSAVDGLRTMSTTQPGVAKVGAGLAMNNGALELDGNGDIATAVTSWLNAHPEATTTVEDGSITLGKMDNDAKVALQKKADDLANYQGFALIDQSISGTRYVAIEVPIPKGTYTLYVDGVTTEAELTHNRCQIALRNNSVGFMYVYANGGNVETDLTFETTNDGDSIIFMAGSDYASSADKAFEYHNVTLVRHMNLTKRLDALEDDSYKYEEYIYDGTELLKGKFVKGSLTAGAINMGLTYRVATPDVMTYDKPLKLHIMEGFRIGVHYFEDGAFVRDSGWKTGQYDIAENSTFKVVIARVTEDTSSYADVREFETAVTIETQEQSITKINNRLSVVENLFRFKKYFSHLGVTQLASGIVTPPQSIFDVLRAKRLGFDVLELNVHKLSDGNYICLHGQGGNFGDHFVDTNGNAITGTIASKTLAWIKDNVRYVSRYPKYRVAPFSLQEMLAECKKLNIVPLVQYIDSAEVRILDEYMGLNNYILNVYQAARLDKSDAVLGSWLTIADSSEVIAKANESGPSYICGINASNEIFNDFTLADWQDYVHAIHLAGYPVNYAYVRQDEAQVLWNAGFDAAAALVEINDFCNGNILNLDAGNTFSGFVTNGTVSDGVLSLTSGQTVSIDGASLPIVNLGGMSMHIRFSGELTIALGWFTGTYESDGMSDTWVSSYIEDARPFMTITANGDTEIYDITLNASKM